VLANLEAQDAPALARLQEPAAVQRAAVALERRAGLPAAEKDAVTRFTLAYEEAVARSRARYLGLGETRFALEATLRQVLGSPPPATKSAGPAARVYRRNPEVKGPVTVFGYDYLAAHLPSERAEALALPKHTGLRAEGDAYAYEVLNLVDGHRTAQQVRDDVSAIYGPVPLEAVRDYLKALEDVGLVN
jgi:hypothetical protein